MHFSKNQQETLRNKIYYSRMLEGTRHARGPHSNVLGSTRRGSTTWCSAFIMFQGGVSRVLCVHPFISCLKVWEQELGLGKGVVGSLKWSVIQITQGCRKKGASWVGDPSSSSGCFASNCVIHLAMCLFKMDVFWNGCLSNQKLNVSTYATIRKFNVRHLHYRRALEMVNM